MNEELQDCLRQIEAVKRDAQALVSGLSDAPFNWRPEPGRWSVAQCLDHLNVATAKTLPAFDRAISDARSRRLVAPGPFRYAWFANWMVRSMEPPVKRRMRTVKIFTPAPERRVAEVVPEFLRVCDQPAERVRQGTGSI